MPVARTCVFQLLYVLCRGYDNVRPGSRFNPETTGLVGNLEMFVFFVDGLVYIYALYLSLFDMFGTGL